MNSLALQVPISFINTIELLEVFDDVLEKEETETGSSSATKNAQGIAAFGEANGDKATHAAFAFGLLGNPLAFLAIHQAHFPLPAYSESNSIGNYDAFIIFLNDFRLYKICLIFLFTIC